MSNPLTPEQLRRVDAWIAVDTRRTWEEQRKRMDAMMGKRPRKDK